MKFVVLLLSVLLLGACSTEGELAAHVAKNIRKPGEISSNSTFKIGNPYKVEDRWYQPKETYEFSETGIASWYGPTFHGKRTANGEIFDQNELTAAHRTLQMPSLVRVTNLENGRSIVVRINDRGPFSKGRVIDVSKRSAELLGFKAKGTAKVRLDLLGPESREIAQAAKRGMDTSGVEIAMNERPHVQLASLNTASSQPQYAMADPTHVAGHVEQGRFLPDPVVSQYPVKPTNIYVQAGAFTNEGNALRLSESLSEINTTTVQTVLVRGQQFHRVRMGPLSSVEQADALMIELGHRGFEAAQIVVD